MSLRRFLERISLVADRMAGTLLRTGNKVLLDSGSKTLLYISFMQESLLNFVMRELQERKGQWPSISTGANVGYSWLSKFAQGKIPKPGYHQVERLATYFREGKQS